MNVALVLGSSTGGMLRHVRALIIGAVGAGARVDVYCPPEHAVDGSLAAAGAKVTEIEIPATTGPRDANAVSRLRRALRAEPVDVIHAQGLRAGLVASLARAGSTPLVVTWHTTLLGHGLGRMARLAVARTVANTADVNLCASVELVQTATRLGARDARLAMPGAPALPPPTRTRAEVRAEFDLAPDAPLVLAVGRLQREKRHDILVTAASRWRPLRPTPTAIIVGTGPAYRTLAAQIITARAPVILAGERTDLADLVHAADVAVVTTEGEASSLFIQEVLVAGVPLVCTSVDGVPELVGGAAVLIPPGDADAADAAILSLLQDPGRRQARATAGHALARTWPTEAEAVRRVLAVYAELGANGDDQEEDSRDAPHGTR